MLTRAIRKGCEGQLALIPFSNELQFSGESHGRNTFMETQTIENPVLTKEQASATQPRQSTRNRRAARTLESQPQSNRAAVSTPIAVNYLTVVKECAHQKGAEGG